MDEFGTTKISEAKQEKTPDIEGRHSIYPSNTQGRLALSVFSGTIVVWFLLLISTIYLFYLDSTTEISGAEWGFVLVIIPGFFISPVVAFIPGGLGCLLGARVATWLENRFQRTIDPKIGPIIGGALGILEPLLVIFLVYSLDYL